MTRGVGFFAALVVLDLTGSSLMFSLCSTEVLSPICVDARTVFGRLTRDSPECTVDNLCLVELLFFGDPRSTFGEMIARWLPESCLLSRGMLSSDASESSATDLRSWLNFLADRVGDKVAFGLPCVDLDSLTYELPLETGGTSGVSPLFIFSAMPLWLTSRRKLT